MISSSANLLLLIAVLSVGIFVFLNHQLNSLHEIHLQEMSTSEVITTDMAEAMTNYKRLDHLMSQTQKLLVDLAQQNITVTPQLLSRIKSLGEEEKGIGKDEARLERMLQQQREQHAACVGDKGKFQLKLEESLLQIENLKESLQKAVEVKTVPKEEEDVSHQSLQKKWLIIGIPTVARANNEDYLIKTLVAIARQLPQTSDDPMYNNIIVNVVNMQVNADPARKHIRFDEAVKMFGEYSDSPHKVYFRFSELTVEEILPDPVPNKNAQNDQGNANKPGFLVRRQTRNIATVMRKSIGLASHYLFLEDDMKLCAHGIQAIHYLLQKSTRYHGDWLAIRASYGMNGIFMHDKDLATFADYLIKHQIRRPPDHLVVEWYAGENPESAGYKKGRKNIGFKFNLFDHLGVVSTLRSQKSTSYPRCYDTLFEPTVFKVEAFSPRDCPKDDVWPCNIQHPERALIDWSLVHER